MELTIKVQSGCVISAILLGCAAPAMADQIPVEFRGVWSQRCADPSAPKISLSADKVTIASAGRDHVYAGRTELYLVWGSTGERQSRLATDKQDAGSAL